MTNTQTLIAKLKNIDATMTRGKWLTRGSGDWGMARTEYIEAIDGQAFVEIAETTRGAMSAFKTPDSAKVRQGRIDFDGIAALKNANPHVVAMLERAAELRAELLIDSSISATTTRKLLKFDAEIERLAAEAMKEMG